jgi:hypothetical protein
MAKRVKKIRKKKTAGKAVYGKSKKGSKKSSSKSSSATKKPKRIKSPGKTSRVKSAVKKSKTGSSSGKRLAREGFKVKVMNKIRDEFPHNVKHAFGRNGFKEEVITSKYLPHEELGHIISETAFDFPAGYGDNKIVAMVRDPWWIYSYWEVAGDKEEKVKKSIRNDGAEPSKSLLRVYDVTDTDINKSESNGHFDIELENLANNWYVHVNQPDRAWCIDIGILASNDKFYTLARSNVVKTPRYGPSDVLDEEWMVPEDLFWRLFGLSGGYGVNKSSLEMKKEFKKHLEQKAWSGGIFSGASGFRAMEKLRKFWLVADCELIVYGATEPDAKVTIQGRPIALRKDGTFTARFNFPDGSQSIPIEATAADGSETRNIMFDVKRKTKHNP